jgi:hypothetical protein
MKRNARKTYFLSKGNRPPLLSGVAFTACVLLAIGGKWFRELELWQASLVPLTGGYQWHRRDLWVAEGSVGFSDFETTLAATGNVERFAGRSPPHGWRFDTQDPGTRFQNRPLTGLAPFGYAIDGYGPQSRTPGNDMFSARFPLWPLVVLLGIAPGRRVYRWCVGERDARKGCCRGCGYDLRFTPDRCPECGAPAPETPSATPPRVSPVVAAPRS